MDKTKIVLREGYVYREDKGYGQVDCLYCVLKPNSLSFHRRKVHKRHTPLCLLRLEDLSIEMDDRGCFAGDIDCNNNITSRFPWIVTSGAHVLYLYCSSLEDSKEWIKAIEDCQKNLTRPVTESNKNIEEKVQCKVDINQTKNSVDDTPLFNVVTGDNKWNSLNKTEAVKTVSNRIRSRSFSELETVNNVDVLCKVEHNIKYMKSAKSAPLDSGKLGFKTVDKLINVQTGLCRQFVRWI